jgi:hypothetical protein
MPMDFGLRRSDSSGPSNISEDPLQSGSSSKDQNQICLKPERIAGFKTNESG